MKVSLKIPAMSAPRFHNLESGGLQSRLRWWIRSPAGTATERVASRCWQRSTHLCFYVQILYHAISSITGSSSETSTKNLKLQEGLITTVFPEFDHHWPFKNRQKCWNALDLQCVNPPWLSPHINGNKNTIFITWSSLESWAKPPNLGETSPTADLAQYRGRDAE